VTDVGSAIVYKWFFYSQRYLVLGLVGLVGLGLPLLLQLVLVGLALWLVSGIALNKGIPVNGGPKFLYHVKQHMSNSQRYLVVGLV